MGMDEHDAEGRVLVAEYPVLHVVGGEMRMIKHICTYLPA
jgi:hypothetical protein